MFLHNYAKNISEGDQESKITYFASTQQSNIIKHMPIIIATTLGHLDLERKNLQSTKQVKPEL